MAQLYAANVFRTRAAAEYQTSGEASARLAVALDGTNALAHSWLSNALFLHGDLSGALAAANRALALSPNLASAYWRKGAALIFSGQPQEGLRNAQTSLRLDPRGPDLAHRLTYIAIGCYYSRAYKAAAEAAKHTISSFREFPLPYRWLAAALGQLGLEEDAKKALEQAITVAPASFDLFVRGRPPWFRQEDHDHMMEGLRKAGWREA